MLPEKAHRRRFGTVQAIAEIDFVQIQLEDLVLRVGPLEPRGEQDFPEFPAQRFVSVEKTLSRQLLRDGAPALRPPSSSQVSEDRAEYADGINAVVFVEPLILDRQDRLGQERRHLRERHVNALFLVDLEDRRIVRIEERRGL